MPNKKKTRVRNRPRNKANRLKLLENENSSENSAINKIGDPEDKSDDDMPDLIDDNPKSAKQNSICIENIEDPIQAMQRLLRNKLLQKHLKAEPTGSVSAKDIKKNNQHEDLKVTPSNSANIKQPKLKEKKLEGCVDEKSAFIHSLEKQMEAMMVKEDENLPNTIMNNLKKLFDQGPITDFESSDDDEEYIEYIYKSRKYFLVSLCNLCKTDLCKLHKLVECSKCHMTYYCRLEHMHNDTEHQQLCYALQQVSNSCGGHVLKKCSAMDTKHFRSYRIMTIRKVESILNRSLTAMEQEVILFPRICCNGYCREFRFDALRDCPDCGMISYCIDHPEHVNREQHTKWCKSYQLFKELVELQEKFGRLDPGLPSKVLKEIPLACTTTKEMYTKLGFDISENSEYATLTQISTGPLTAWYALKLADQLNCHESLTIHLIGAEIEFEVDVLHKWEIFFLHITPSVKNLNIVFVGPELNPQNISFEQLQKTKCCGACRKSSRIVKYFFESYIYHDYCRSNNYLKPNLICFFNAGLYRSSGYNMEDTWPETILAASKLQVPTVVTAYTEYESPLDMTRFAVECQRKLKIIQAPAKNPFASVKPERNFISDDEAPLMFKNYYYFVIE